MLYVLYTNTGVHSGRALRHRLSDIQTQPVRGGFPKRLANLLRRGETPSLIINLGVTEDLQYTGRILNSQDMVRAASNKKGARKLFLEKGIPSPKLHLATGNIVKADLPLIGRTSYHKKGRGFWLCNTLAEVRRANKEGATHFLELVDNTREYRVHTFIKKKYIDLPKEEREAEHYVSVKISEKAWQGEGQPNKNEPQKNHEFGWVFLGQQNRREEELDVVRYAAKQAIAALGMDFGAADIMYRIRTKDPYVLEVNSSPSLSDENATTCEVYANRILKTIEEGTKK